ncbi:ATP-binding protein [Cereibacter sp. SYSU M97828]|nr:ATP-binding protein [Cereibacter flavus]
MNQTTDGRDLALLVQLRWLAVAGQIATILVAHHIIGIRLPLLPMCLVLLLLVAVNFISLTRLRRWKWALPVELLIDVLALATQLALSGGATNPFTTLFLLQITLSAVLLPREISWSLVGLMSVIFALLTEFHLPLMLPEGMDFFPVYLGGMFVGLTLDAVLIVAFVTRVAANLSDRTARLERLRQRAAEEDHIVRMGLFASGAAHELGTPLASISVILGDWRHSVTDPEQREDIAVMQRAVDRCKAIVTGILMTSGEARGEAPRVTGVHDFVADLAAEWARGRNFHGLVLEDRFGDDVPIVSDATLKKMLMNVLDNAHEVSPDWVALEAARLGGDLVLTVRDRGPGFAREMLLDFGRPYSSTKGAAGRGLGLFLAVSALRKLGGDVSAHNADDGAVVTVRLPLASLALEGDDV